MEKLTKTNVDYIGEESGVYIIFSYKKPNMMYIGSSKNCRKRYKEHYRQLVNKKHYNKKLQNHVNKYGIEDLGFCLHIFCKDLKELRKIEIEEIKFFDCYKNGFNLTDESWEARTIFFTKEVRKIISDKSRERQSRPEVKKAMTLARSGVFGNNSKLSLKDVRYIRKNFKRINSRKSNVLKLAKKFNIDRRNILRIVKYETYKINC